MRAAVTALLLVTSGCTLIYGGTNVARDHDGGPTDGAIPGAPDAAQCSCTSPPEPVCVDARTLRSYRQAGVCDGQECSYSYTDATCQTSCASGRCAGDDPCQGVICSTPPAPFCAQDGFTLVTSSDNGTCSRGSCAYATTMQVCASGCNNGACVSIDPCSGVVCNTPPAPSCVDASTLATYAQTGTCSAGTCTYQVMDTTCSGSCSNGVCSSANPCAGVTCDTPPANVCANGTTLRIYASAGTCSSGACSYTHTNAVCPAPVNGVATCKSATCGVTCNSGYTWDGAECVASASSCGTVTFAGVCNGSVVEWCSNSGTLATQDCSEEGLDCVTQVGGASCQ